jgi:glucokinase
MVFLGIEIGGTKLQLGVGPGDGTIAAIERAAVEPAAGADGIRLQILELVLKLLAQTGLAHCDIQAVGIGFGGPVRADLSTVTKSHQIAGWDDFPLGDWSRHELGWPTIVHNDADTAGLAEACFGAGRGCSPVFYITIGSGIGGGLVIDQKIYRGAGDGAAELGHLLLPDHAAYFEMPDAKGIERPSTVESLCSGWSMTRLARGAIDFAQGTGQSLFCDSKPEHARQLLDLVQDRADQITPPVLAAAARAGNPLACAILRSRCRILGWAIAQMITLLCPRRVVIGGGVSQIGEDLFLTPVREATAQHVFGPFARSYEIVPASLGESVVVHGALRLARDLVVGETHLAGGRDSLE